MSSHEYGEDDSNNGVTDGDGEARHPRFAKSADDFKWTERSARRLLELRFEREADFSKPSSRKTKLWEHIAQEMMNAGYHINAHGCDNKYRNLLATYRKNKIKLVTNEETSVSWEFFELMDYYLGAKYDAAIESATAAAPAIDYGMAFDQSDFEERYVVTQPPAKKFKAIGNVSATYAIPSEERKLSTQEYFYEKIQLDSQAFKEDSRRKARQLEIQERKLKLTEKRVDLEIKRYELETRKVEALAALAEAVSALKSIVK